jgi:hypothetical protein
MPPNLTLRYAPDSVKISASNICWGIAKLVKAPDSESGTRRFESFFPCH